ncbi:ATPase inhibitor subunit zeta [Rhizobium sp. RU36D]|uniref:ATPase inhibitor subunit zeta n=1 Tax=Rhizobium sp. RU36D TaxID=1907415 RepID=UPI0009D81657|nr:ATPase inhibitor subunit zeta [Rhizobium sp. RU36D]SMC99964.1 hypothetical protein SAMN05880593_11472 [Rhizobium sp. RU36D]
MTQATLKRVIHVEFAPEVRSAKEDGLTSVRARRNLLVGHWAGGLLGLRDEALAHYAHALHISDHVTTGDGDVIAKLKQDFEQNSVVVEHDEILRVLRDGHRQALRETSCTE